MNGVTHYLLVGPQNVHLTLESIELNQPEWLGISLYTGLTTYVFEWLLQYKIDKARSITKKNISDFETADKLLKGMVRETNGPVYEGNQLVYAPVSYERTDAGPMTGPLIYKINKDYNPSEEFVGNPVR